MTRIVRLTLLLAVLWVSTAKVGLAVEHTHFAAPEAETGQLNIFSSTDLEAIRPLIRDFQKLHPGVAIDYIDLFTADLYDVIRRNAPVEGRHPDLVISSAMDMQTKLVNDGFAKRHVSPETEMLPPWANWRNEAFGFTFEPAVIVYNSSVLEPEDVPQTRFELVRLLREKADTYRGRVATYDIAQSGVGYLFATQDALQAHTYGRLIESFGRTDVLLATSTSDMLDAIVAGRILIGYNLLGSYTRLRIAHGAPLAMVLPSDYTLVLSRVAFIHRDARHDATARSFLDYLLSRRGQTVMAGESHLYAIHPDIKGPATASELREKATGPLRPIRLGPGLLVFLDKLKQGRFLYDWHATVSRYGLSEQD